MQRKVRLEGKWNETSLDTVFQKGCALVYRTKPWQDTSRMAEIVQKVSIDFATSEEYLRGEIINLSGKKVFITLEWED